MNKERRERLRNVIRAIQNVTDNLKSILDDEQWAYDSMPENLQCSMRGSDSEEAISTMEEAQENLQQAIDLIQDVIDI